jgi:curved DNA-binding protein CbpA
MYDMTNRIANPYAVLGVPPTASATQVREAYRRLAKRYHPDLRRDPESTERMQRINLAWEMLSSPAARVRNDADRPEPAATAYSHWGGSSRSAQPRYSARQSWNASQAAHAAEAIRDEEASPVRWAFLLLAVPAVVLLTALFGGLVPFPILGILLFFVARAAFRAGD